MTEEEELQLFDELQDLGAGEAAGKKG